VAIITTILDAMLDHNAEEKERGRGAGTQIRAARRQWMAMADEGREMKDVVCGDVEASAERRREELEPGDFTIAALEDAARPDKRAPSNAAHEVVCWRAAPRRRAR